MGIRFTLAPHTFYLLSQLAVFRQSNYTPPEATSKRVYLLSISPHSTLGGTPYLQTIPCRHYKRHRRNGEDCPLTVFMSLKVGMPTGSGTGAAMRKTVKVHNLLG